MAFRIKPRCSIFPLLLLLSIFLAFFTVYPQTSEPAGASSAGHQIGKVMSVRQQKHIGMYPFTRYPSIAQFTIDFAVRTSDQSYCTEYETPVLEELMDLLDAKDKNVKLEVRDKKKMTVILPSGRKINARLVKATQC